MKRKAIVATAGVAVVGALIYVGGLWAQSSVPSVPARPAASPRTKIALLNLTYVISYYGKYQAYKEEMKTIAKPFEDQIKGKQAELEAFRSAIRGTMLAGFIRDESVEWADAQNEFRGFEIVR